MLLPRHFHPKKYIKTEHYYLVIMISFPDLMISKKTLDADRRYFRVPNCNI